MSGQRVRQSWPCGLGWHGPCGFNGPVEENGIGWSGSALGLYGGAGQALGLRRALGAERCSGPGLHNCKWACKVEGLCLWPHSSHDPTEQERSPPSVTGPCEAGGGTELCVCLGLASVRGLWEMSSKSCTMPPLAGAHPELTAPTWEVQMTKDWRIADPWLLSSNPTPQTSASLVTPDLGVSLVPSSLFCSKMLLG